MSDYQLGDRVRMIGTAEKCKRHRKITYEEAPIPVTNLYPTAKTHDSGIVVGSRTVMEGEVDWSEGWITFCPDRGTAVKVWLVAFDLRRKPVMCFDGQITKETP